MAQQLQENIAGTLCYSLGWLTGLIFFLIDKRSSVRFHAAQSMVVFGGLQIISIVLSRLALGTIVGIMIEIVDLAGVVLWIVLMVKTYQGEKFKVPVAANIAENIVH